MKKRQMVRSRINPDLIGYIVKRISDKVFVVSVRGQELHAAIDYWEAY